jgi:hypothetical protein
MEIVARVVGLIFGGIGTLLLMEGLAHALKPVDPSMFYPIGKWPPTIMALVLGLVSFAVGMITQFPGGWQ